MTSIQQKGKYFLVKSNFGSFSLNNKFDALKLCSILADYEELCDELKQEN